MLGSAFLLRPLNDLIGRQPATIVWLVGVAAATWALWVWLGNGRLDRIEAGPLGAPGRAWGRIHDRFEHVFVALGTFHALLIFAGFLYGIAQTGPVARWIVIAFAVFMAVVVPWAWIAGRREQTARARERAERELAYARRTNTRRLDDFAS
ncbi:MAG: hypothetical protein J7513_02040 [Solirubrobacteraceae bacterium]|nr:hypothetical protein [Solirubrobacteraceae bacterium]